MIKWWKELSDYYKHLIVGFGLGVVFTILLAPILAPTVGFCVSLGIVTLIGLGKELYDSKQPGNRFDWKDLLMTVEGGIFGCLLGIIIRGLFKF